MSEESPGRAAQAVSNNKCEGHLVAKSGGHHRHIDGGRLETR